MHLAIEAVGAKHGGAATVLTATSQAALELDKVSRVTVFCSPQTIREFALPTDARLRVKEPAWAEGAAGRALWYSAGLLRALEACRPDAVLLLNGAGRTPKGMRTAVFIQQSLPYATDVMTLFGRRSRWRLRAVKAANRMACKAADIVLVQSQWMASVVRSEFALVESRVEVCAPGPSLPPAGKAGDRLIRMRAYSGRRVLYVGSDAKHKNLSVARKAVAELRRRGLDVQLFATVAGDGEGTQGDMVCLGRIDASEVSAAYSLADALVMPSLVETVGLPLLEAALQRIPIAAADRPYAREICGEAAVYFDPHDVGDCARAVGAILESRVLSEALSEKGLKRVRARLERRPYHAMIQAALGQEGGRF